MCIRVQDVNMNEMSCSFPSKFRFLHVQQGWLDDIGLPQYKTQFDEGRVDGRMLHYMTVVSVDEQASTRP